MLPCHLELSRPSEDGSLATLPDLASGGMATTPEGEILSAICEYLALKGYLFSRTNNGAVYDPSKGLFRKPPKFVRHGWPDICLIRAGKFYGIEVKSKTGKLSTEQAQLGIEITKNGGEYIVARSIEDIQNAGL